jgi:hypothetical protein
MGTVSTASFALSGYSVKSPAGSAHFRDQLGGSHRPTSVGPLAPPSGRGQGSNDPAGRTSAFRRDAEPSTSENPKCLYTP